jgi:7-cyano-7-deazaguanine reductase
MTTTDVSGLSQLGQNVTAPQNPEDGRARAVPTSHTGTDYVVRFTAPEFTSLCPMTGQPDFAHIVIDYVPDGWLVESKSLKLFLHSFRNHGAFHEDCTIDIAKRLVDLLAPKWLRIGAYWYPRGGIPIDVFWQTGARRRDCGCRIRASSPIVDAAETKNGGLFGPPFFVEDVDQLKISANPANAVIPPRMREMIRPDDSLLILTPRPMPAMCSSAVAIMKPVLKGRAPAAPSSPPWA